LQTKSSQKENRCPYTLSRVKTKITHAANLIRHSKKTVMLTGAGISTPSGIPDFRSAGSGLWTKYLPMEVASLSVFRRDSEKFFAWLRPLASHMLTAKPNPAHLAIAMLEKKGIIHTLITQNIDTLHHKAGSKNILEVHGTLNTLTCTACYQQYSSIDFLEPYLESGQIPYCPNCGHILKPDIILFEEQLPIQTWLNAKYASETCSLMIVAGSSLTVAPTASLPMHAINNHAKLIVINRTKTYIDVRADIVLTGDVADIIPLIAQELLNDNERST